MAPVNVYECFAPSSVNVQPARFTEDEPLFVIVTASSSSSFPQAFAGRSYITKSGHRPDPPPHEA